MELAIARQRRESLLGRRSVAWLALFGGTALAFRWPGPFGNISLSRMAAFLVIGLLFVDEASGRPVALSSRLTPVLGSGLALLTVVVFGLLFTPSFHLGVYQAGNVGEALILLVGTYLLAQRAVGVDPLARARWARLPLWGFLPTGLLGLYQAIELFLGRVPTIPLISLSNADPAYSASRTLFNEGLNSLGLDRVAGATGDPPTFGILCAVVVVYALWARRERLERWSPLLCTVVALGTFNVILSASAAAIVVLFVGAFLLFIPLDRRIEILLRASVVVVVVVVLSTQVAFVRDFYDSARLRIGSLVTGQGTASQHLTLFRTAWNLFVSHPVFGVGPGGLGVHQYGYDVGYSSVHNAFLLTLAEEGLVGGAALLALMITAWRRLCPRPVLITAMLGLFLYLDVNRMPYIWAMLGVAAAVAAPYSKSESPA